MDSTSRTIIAIAMFHILAHGRADEPAATGARGKGDAASQAAAPA